MKIILMSLSLLASMYISTAAIAAENKLVVIPLGGGGYTNQIFYYNLPPSAFVPVLTTDSTPRVNFAAGDSLFLYGTDTTIGLAAPVQLPDEAELSDFNCYVYDNETTIDISSNSPASLWRRPVLATEEEVITGNFNMQTTGSLTTIQPFSAPSIDYPTIDNSAYFYGAYVLFKLTGTPTTSPYKLRFYGCRISYTLDVLTP